MHIPRTFYRIIFFSALTGLLVISSIPDITANMPADNEGSGFRFDYLFHFLAYAGITFLYTRAYRPTWYGLLMIIAFAALEELHQYWIPGRTVNPVDFGFDVAGLAMVVLVWLRNHRISGRF